MTNHCLNHAVSVVLTLLVVTSVGAAKEKEPKGPFKALEYRLIGPAAGGRVSRVAGVPGDPRVYWAATASGGVWKSVNGGSKWQPVFDDQAVSSIGSIAIAPSDANVVWVGSGEANIRGNVAEGNGIYRTTDAGKTWSRVWAEGLMRFRNTPSGGISLRSTAPPAVTPGLLVSVTTAVA